MRSRYFVFAVLVSVAVHAAVLMHPPFFASSASVSLRHGVFKTRVVRAVRMPAPLPPLPWMRRGRTRAGPVVPVPPPVASAPVILRAEAAPITVFRPPPQPSGVGMSGEPAYRAYLAAQQRAARAQALGQQLAQNHRDLAISLPYRIDCIQPSAADDLVCDPPPDETVRPHIEQLLALAVQAHQLGLLPSRMHFEFDADRSISIQLYAQGVSDLTRAP